MLSLELEKDAAERTAPALVKRYRSMEDYVRAAGASDPELMIEVADLVEAEAARLAVNVRVAMEGMTSRWEAAHDRQSWTIDDST